MICWYCYWGWPEPVVKIYQKAIKALGGDESPLHWGPAHIVWEDENFDSAKTCIRFIDADQHCKGFSKDDLAIVRQSLVELDALPKEIRDPEPDDYDGKHPENFPPPEGMVMIKA